MTFTKRNPSFTNKAPTTFQAGDTAGIQMWLKQRQTEMNQNNLVYGRILDTGINYIVEGFKMDKTKLAWVTIPCHRLLDARLHLAEVMDKGAFDILKEEWR